MTRRPTCDARFSDDYCLEALLLPPLGFLLSSCSLLNTRLMLPDFEGWQDSTETINHETSSPIPSTRDSYTQIPSQRQQRRSIMRFCKTSAAAAALVGLVNAQSVPSKVSILTPLNGGSVGVEGAKWMVDVVVEFTPPKSSSAATTSSAPAAASSPSSSSGGYRRRAVDDAGFFPFLNSPNLTSFKPGPDIAAPGFVCLLNTSSDPTQNLAGVFQLNAITNSDAQGNILEAYYSWYVKAPNFGSNVFSEVTVFFLNGPAPAKYTGDPKNDPNVISNVAVADFFINGNNASTTTGPATQETPLSITLFTPTSGDVVGVNGAGWMVDMVVVNNDTTANYFSPSNGVNALYHDNFTDPKFAPGVVSEALPGLVVLSNTSTLAGGPSANLANLFQINAVTGVKNDVITEFWMTWLVGAPFAGKGQPSSLTIYVVNGTAPTNITSTPSNIISNMVTVDFTLSDDGTASTGGSTSSGSGSKTNSATSSRVFSAGAVVLAAMGVSAFLA
ncbi:hypothetical protein VTK73DRAFT_9799 [Phialemonium thermophilum]|uniref:Uncharacterized protein n=1 Tax=Phialemonium thermophilum TaxID=223376 RepID=A0ABR3W084_9PEZI